MATVFESINLSVDTGDLDQLLGDQVAQLQQIVEGISALADSPPTEVGELADLATNLPLPEFALDIDFVAVLNQARNRLPTDPGEISASVDGELAKFTDIVAQLDEILQDAVRVAAAVEKLISMDFSCGSEQTSTTQGQDDSSDPAPNTGANRMALAAQQTQQVNEMLDRLPDSPSVGGLLEFFFPIIDHKQRDNFFQLSLPIYDDIVEPLRTLSRWATLDPNAVVGEIEATLLTLNQRLLAISVSPINELGIQLADLQPRLVLPELTAFADAYANALEQLLIALEATDLAAINTAATALETAFNDAAATLNAWEADAAADLNAACNQLRNLAESMHDRLTHLLMLLEPVSLPSNLVDALPAPESPSEQVIAEIQEAVQPVFDWLEELVGLLDFSGLQSEVGNIASQAQQLADGVEQGLTGVALQVRSLFSEIQDQIQTVGLDQVNQLFNSEIQQFDANLRRRLSDAFGPANAAIGGATQSVSNVVDAFNPAGVLDALRAVLQAITSVLETGEIGDAIKTLSESLRKIADALAQISFTPVTDEVVALIDQMSAALRKLQASDLNSAAKNALTSVLNGLPADLKPITDPLLKNFDDLVEEGPIPLLQQVAEKPAQLLEQIEQFEPSRLIGDKLANPYKDLLTEAEMFRPSQLFEAIDEQLQTAKQQLLQQAAPSQALNELGKPFDSLKNQLQAYSPEVILQPLEDKIEATIKEVVEASPVDEILEPINRVFEIITQALSFPQNLLATLQRFDDLLTSLADPNQQIDNWRDQLLDKVSGADNLSTVANALTELNQALTATSHSAVLGSFDTQIGGILSALDDFDPGARTTSLVNAYNSALSLTNNLADSPEKTAALAALQVFDPSRAPSLLLTLLLQQCLQQSRVDFVALQGQWQDLLESPDSLLSEIAGVTGDADGLRALLATEIEPLLAPLRHLFLIFESVHTSIQAMFTTLSASVDQISAGAAALVTGPGSLQSISDAIQQVVDTLRNIDLGFLRESLQQLHLELLDQIDALNPGKLADDLDESFEALIESLTFQQLIPDGSLETLDGDYQAVIEKLQQLDPQVIVNEVIQPEYDATVGPLIEAFDLSPVFNAVIEFLQRLDSELGTELDRVNTAYQGFQGSRSASSGTSSVSIGT